MHKYTNRLINENSPYLLQHAHNPVDWYPWGEEALEKAKREDKPILVSIGYAACHWCHVMERESFENEDTARMMNEYFINIKIDREERPDIDHLYMDAVQAISGSGGWPLNVFLTPDCKPFYGGTYFPPVRAFNRSSWRETISSINEVYKDKRTEIESEAEKLTNHLQSANAFGFTNADIQASTFTKENLQAIAQNILKSADRDWGGFGKAPKFPQTFAIQYLLRHYHFTKDEASLQHALLTIDKMIYGGIYDQLGGGFARYSTDDRWLAPHFEKMLYDNALLLIILAEAYQLTGKELYATTIRHTIDFIKRELWNDEGGFFSALDADSEGVEGKFYTWSKQEIDSILGDDSDVFCEFYNVLEEGNWEETNILWITTPPGVFAAGKGVDPDELQALLSRCRDKLMQVRAKRIRPLLDDKVLLSWNALMNIACSKAYAALGEEEYKELALKNMSFLERRFSGGEDGQWYHTYKNGQQKYHAFLDDYAYLIQAFIALQEISGITEYLTKAKAVTELILMKFGEEHGDFFYFTHTSQKDIIVRKKEVYDGATPSGNSVMALNLHYLSVVFNKADWFKKSQKMTSSLSQAIIRYPTSFGLWATNIQQMYYGLNEIAVVGKEIKSILKGLLKEYIPNRVLQSATETNQEYPLLEGKQVEHEAKIYLCKNYACQKPVESIEELVRML